MTRRADAVDGASDGVRYDLHAIRFCTRAARVGDHFVERVEDADEAMPIDYYLWVARSEGTVVVVDAGFTEEVSRRRGAGRRYLASPIHTLARLGVEPEDVDVLVLSHLHYDHTGHLDAFPRAEVIVQQRELAFWCGPHAHRPTFAPFCEPDDVARLVRRNLAGELRLVDGDGEVAPGVTVHLVGGHTPGTQIVRIPTERGAVVLACDAAHFYANLERRRPYALVHTLPSMYDAFDRALELADAPELVVPGHDPLVRERFQPLAGVEDDLIVRIA